MTELILNHHCRLTDHSGRGRLTERMDELDRRLDIQDILITIDEKLDRSPIAR